MAGVAALKFTVLLVLGIISVVFANLAAEEQQWERVFEQTPGEFNAMQTDTPGPLYRPQERGFLEEYKQTDWERKQPLYDADVVEQVEMMESGCFTLSIPIGITTLRISACEAKSRNGCGHVDVVDTRTAAVVSRTQICKRGCVVYYNYTL